MENTIQHHEQKNVINFINRHSSEGGINWEKEESYSANQLIDAYLYGKKTALDIQQRAIQDYFDKNKDIIDDFTEKIYNWILDNKYNIHQIRLKIVNINDFEVLAIVSDGLDNLEEYLAVYKFANELIDKFNTDDFNLTFSILPNNKNLDINLIINDGFGLKYVPQKRD